MITRLITSAFVAIIHALTTSSALGAWDHNYHFGPLQGRGKPGVHENAGFVEITSVSDGGRLQLAGLMKGDLIRTVNGRAVNIDWNRHIALGRGIDESVREKKPLVLGILRAGRAEEIRVDVAGITAFSPDFPYNCEKSDALLDAALKRIHSLRGKNGRWAVPKYMQGLIGLSLLTRDNTTDLKAAEELALRLIGNDGRCGLPEEPRGPRNQKNWNGLQNWGAVSTGMFIAEYVRLSGDNNPLFNTAFETLIRHFELEMQDPGMPNPGLMGHHWGGNYKGGGMTIMNTQAQLFFSSAARLGHHPSAERLALNEQGIMKSMSGRGNVGYSPRATYSIKDAGGRTGSALAAFASQNKHPVVRDRLAAFISHGAPTRIYHSHASSLMGLVFCTWGTHAHGYASTRDFLDHFRWWFTLCASEGDAFVFQNPLGQDDNSLRRQFVGPVQMALVLGVKNGRLSYAGPAYDQSDDPVNITLTTGETLASEDTAEVTLPFTLKATNFSGAPIEDLKWTWGVALAGGSAMLQEGTGDKASFVVEHASPHFVSVRATSSSGRILDRRIELEVPLTDSILPVWFTEGEGGACEVDGSSIRYNRAAGSTSEFTIHRAFDGDGEVIVHLKNLEGSNYSRVAMMLRSDVGPGSPECAILHLAGRSIANKARRHRARVVPGGSMIAGGRNIPHDNRFFLRVRRNGRQIIFSDSKDGHSGWRTVAQYGLPPGPLRFGFTFSGTVDKAELKIVKVTRW
jgi:hypothetical protein